MFKKFDSRWLHWLAVLALVMNIFAPAMTHAISANLSSSSIEFEVCSATGTKISHHLTIDHSDKSSKLGDSHCPLCTLQTYYFPPIGTFQFQFSVIGRYSYGNHAYQSPSIPILWNTSSPRAPPVQA